MRDLKGTRDFIGNQGDDAAIIKEEAVCLELLWCLCLSENMSNDGAARDY